LVTVRVRECEPPGLLFRYPYIDLVGIDETGARRVLLEGVAPGRRKPKECPVFPSSRQQPVFPAPTAEIVPSDLPGRGRCIGRDDLVRRLLTTVLSKSSPPVPILGPPGVGKSTVTIAMLHHPRVARRFGKHRYFIRCDGATTATALLTVIATGVGVELGPGLSTPWRRFVRGHAAARADALRGQGQEERLGQGQPRPGYGRRSVPNISAPPLELVLKPPDGGASCRRYTKRHRPSGPGTGAPLPNGSHGSRGRRSARHALWLGDGRLPTPRCSEPGWPSCCTDSRP
jgi:hypothetical protein